MSKGLEALSDLRLFTLNCKPYEMQSFSDKCDIISNELKLLDKILKHLKVQGNAINYVNNYLNLDDEIAKENQEIAKLINEII